MLYVLCVAVHILAAAAWVGGSLFFVAAVAPALRRPDLAAARAPLLAALVPRLRALTWLSLSTLVITGVLNLRFRGIKWPELHDVRFWHTGFGHTLRLKLTLVALMAFTAAIHDATAGRSKRLAALTGLVITVGSLAILFLAVALVRGYWL